MVVLLVPLPPSEQSGDMWKSHWQLLLAHRGGSSRGGLSCYFFPPPGGGGEASHLPEWRLWPYQFLDLGWKSLVIHLQVTLELTPPSLSPLCCFQGFWRETWGFQRERGGSRDTVLWSVLLGRTEAAALRVSGRIAGFPSRRGPRIREEKHHPGKQQRWLESQGEWSAASPRGGWGTWAPTSRGETEGWALPTIYRSRQLPPTLLCKLLCWLRSVTILPRLSLGCGGGLSSSPESIQGVWPFPGGPTALPCSVHPGTAGWPGVGWGSSPNHHPDCPLAPCKGPHVTVFGPPRSIRATGMLASESRRKVVGR